MNLYKTLLTTPDWLRASMNVAMLGMIHCHIRLITAEFDEINQKIFVKCFLDREVSEDDNNDIEIMMAEVLSRDGLYDFDYECIYSKHSTRELNHMNGGVFRRKE